MSTAAAPTPVRGQRMRQRMERLRAATRPGIRVVPSNEKMRRLLRHPHAGGFRAEGAADWPNDRFTKRRLADGSIKREERPPSDKDKRGHQHRSSGDAA
jgi:hypothetical protein